MSVSVPVTAEDKKKWKGVVKGMDMGDYEIYNIRVRKGGSGSNI